MADEGASVYAFVDDFLDEGVDVVADRLNFRDFGGVALATVYHAARDIVPHNPRRVVVHREEGVHYFTPNEAAYRGRLQPQLVSGGAARFDTVTAAVRSRGLFWHAWTVYLHNSRLGKQNPDCAIENAFGDIYVTDLCPAHPEVVTYAEDLTTDAARLAPSLVLAESLHFPGFSHGYHHERAFVAMPSAAAFLLSLCFCRHCVQFAGRLDVDVADLRQRIQGLVRGWMLKPASAPGELSRQVLVTECGADMTNFLAAREESVIEITRRCAQIARAAGVDFGFIDQTGALKGYSDGQPAGAPAAEDAWQLGIDPAGVAAACDSYSVLAYAKDPARVSDDTAAYVRQVRNRARLRVVLRHSWPDSASVDDLIPKGRAVVGEGADALDFYHYGLMPLGSLDSASAVLADLKGR